MLAGLRVLGSVLENAFWGLLCIIFLAQRRAVVQVVEVARRGRGGHKNNPETAHDSPRTECSKQNWRKTSLVVRLDISRFKTFV